MRIVGIERINAVSKKTGKLIEAHIVHCIDEGVKSKDLKCGEVVNREFVDDAMFMPFFAAYGNDYSNLMGVEVRFLYNNRGFLEDLMSVALPEKAAK